MHHFAKLGCPVSVVLCVAGLLAAPQDPRALASPGAAYAAKRIGSAVLVGGRALESVMAQEFAPETQLDRILGPMLRPEVDLESGEVWVQLFDARWRAVRRPGFGVTLLRDRAGLDTLPTLPVLEPFPDGLAGQPWPMGDVVGEPNEAAGGVDRAALDAAMTREMDEPTEGREDGALKRTRALLVLHRGQIVGERYAPGFGPESRLEGWSMTKSVLSTLVGIRIGQGALELEGAALLDEWSGEDDPRGGVTLRDLLRMEAGLDWDESYSDVGGDPATMLFTTPDAGGFAASRPLARKPGESWSYSSGTTNIVSLILRRSFESDGDYWRFPRQALFGPLGMRSAEFELDPSGTFVGSSFLWATARDWARFGLLFAQDGVWQGRRILPEGWVAQCVTPAPAARRGQYGLHWWLNHGKDGQRALTGLPSDLFWADGFEGQLVAVFPTQQLVVVRLGCTKSGGLFRQGPLLREILRAFS